MEDVARAALYVRVSTEEQAEEGQSIEAQLAALRAYAVTHGMEVVEEFVDRGFSATTDRRPAFQRMVALARRRPRPFDVILVHKMDRFARNREHAIVYKNLFRRECGINVVSILEPFDESPIGQMMEGLMEIMAEFYSANLSQEVLKGMRHKAQAGAALGLAPIGYRIGPDDRLEPDPATAPVVRWIFEQYAAGVPMNQIVRKLHVEGLALFGPSLPSYKWSVPGIRVILCNETYVGVKVWGLRRKRGSPSEPIRVEGAHEPIVSRELFDRVQNRLLANRGGRSKYGDYLLKGLVRCGACGGGMALVMQTSRPNRSGEREVLPIMVCSRYYKSTSECYPRNWVYMADLEKRIGEALRDLISNNAPLEAYEWELPDDVRRDVSALERRLEALETAFKRQLVAYESGVIDLDELREAKARLSSERQRLQAEVDRVRKEAGMLPRLSKETRASLSRALDALVDGSLPLQTRRAVVQKVLHEAVWDRRTMTLRLRLKAPPLYQS